MTKQIGDKLITELRVMYHDGGAAKSLLDWGANRTNDTTETSVDRVMRMAQVTRGEAVVLLRALDEIGCGKFIVGRKGGKSRISWTFSVRSLGRAARGEAVDIDEVDPEIAEDAFDQQHALPSEALNDRALTIAEAKRGLAATFGVSPEAIDIVIRG